MPYLARFYAILVFGLFSTATVVSIAEEDSGATRIRMPASRHFGRAATIDNRIYIFGGKVGPIDVFDSKTQTWSRLTPDCPASIALYGDQIDGKLYLLDVISRNFVSFDPKARKTISLRPIPTRRINSTVIAANKRLYVIGGYSSDVNKQNCVAVYDPDSDHWTNGPALPTYEPLDHFHCAAVLAGKLHVVGGLLAGNKDQPHWRLDGDRWTRLADAPLHAMWKHAAVTAVAGKLYLLAPHATLPNNRRSSSQDNFYRYEPQVDRWELIGRAPDGIAGTLFIPATSGNNVYFFGGYTGQRQSTSAHVYDAKAERWR